MVMLVVLKRNNKCNKIFFPCNCDGEGYSLKIVMETVVVAIVFNHILSDLCLDFFLFFFFLNSYSSTSLPFTKTKNKNIFRSQLTQVRGTQQMHDPYDSFKLFVSDKMIESTTFYTNMYGRSRFQNKWVECDFVEREAFVGFIVFGSPKTEHAFI